MESGKNHRSDRDIMAQWNNFSEEEKIMVIQDAGKLDPELAIIPVLSGVTSYHFAVRNEAKKGLEFIRSQVNGLFADFENKEQYLKGMKSSASVCYRIYAQIRPDMPQNEIGYFFKLLLKFQGKGPYFASLPSKINSNSAF